MQTESYRTKARNVRQTARAHLLELRKARMALRDSAIAELGDIPAAVQGAPDTHDMADDGPSPAVENGDALDDMAMRNAATPGVVGDPPVIGDEHADAATMVVSDPETETQPSEALPQAQSANAEAPEADWQSSDLAQLPGAGPGLVWILNQCGVFTLQDLAQQEPHALAEKLGGVGQILDVAHWVRLAGEQVSTLGAARAPMHAHLKIPPKPFA